MLHVQVLFKYMYICTRSNYVYTVEPPIKDAPNKGHLRIKDKIQSTKKSLSYSASTNLTSEIKDTCSGPQVSFIRRFHCIGIACVHVL